MGFQRLLCKRPIRMAGQVRLGSRLRQIPAIVASVFYHFGFYFDTAAVIDSIGFDEAEKRRFFAMILSNGLACA